MCNIPRDNGSADAPRTKEAEDKQSKWEVKVTVLSGHIPLHTHVFLAIQQPVANLQGYPSIVAVGRTAHEYIVRHHNDLVII